MFYRNYIKEVYTSYVPVFLLDTSKLLGFKARV